MANLKEAFEYASKNPNSDFAKNLEKMASSGALNLEAKKYGIDLTPFQPQPTAEPVVDKPKRTLGEKVLDFTGGKEIAQGLGQGIANTGFAEKGVKIFGKEIIAPGNVSKEIEQTQSQQMDIQGQLLAKIKENKAMGKDTSRLEQALGLIGQDISKTGQDTEELLNQKGLTTSQVLGDALQLGTTIAGVGSYSKAGIVGNKAMTTGLQKAAPEVVQGLTKGKGILSGIGQGAKTGVITGATQGFAQGTAQGLQEDKSFNDSLKQGVGTGIAGGIFGGVVGGIIGGVSGAVKGSNLRKSIISEQEKSGLRPTLNETIQTKSATNPAFKTMIDEAKKQGYSESDINFLATVSDADKPTLQRMFDATAKAQSNPRQITRAADILGENATGIVRQVQSQNSKAGQLVDQTAKALKGQTFDASPIEQKVLSSLDDAGISIGGDGSVDFSKSIFKNTPKLQKQIERVIRTIPDGSDGYDAHIFKKSVDELVDYGEGGQGLSGKASSLLKGFRTSVDDALDNAFPEYNAANTEYKATKDFIEKVQGVVGKKVDFSTPAGAQSFGQSFRSAFSNNKSRGQTLALIEELQNIAKQRNLKGAEQNLLDQALYVNMLEDQFGTQAATGLAGEVGKALNKAKGAVEIVRNPVTGILNAAANQIEKGQNITPEMKKQLLKAFID